MLVLARRVELEILRDALWFDYREDGRETSMPALSGLIHKKIGILANDEIFPALMRLRAAGYVEEFHKWNGAFRCTLSDYVSAYGRTRGETLFFYRGYFNIVLTQEGRIYCQELHAAAESAPTQVIAGPPAHRRIGF